MKPRKVAFNSVFLLLIVAGLLPVILMISRSLVSDGHISLAHYKSLLLSYRNWVLLKQSLALAFLTTLIATGIGAPLGILFSRTDLAFRRLFALILVTPLLLPPYISAFCWFLVFGREGFIFRRFGREVAGITSSLLFGLPGCVLTLSLCYMPIVVLMVMIYAKTINPDLEAAARIVSRWRRVLWQITLPLILPGVSLAAMLVFLLSMGEFSVPMFLRYNVFPVESFTEFSAFYSFDAATAASIPLVLITILVLAAEDLFLREKTFQLRPAHGQPVPIRLRAWRWPLFVVTALLCFIFVIVPYTVLFVRSGSLAVYGKAFAKAGDSLVRSVVLGVMGASILTILGATSGYIVYKKAIRFWRVMDTLTIFLFALPSTILGAGLVSLWNRPFTNVIYQTFAIILLGYIAQYTALTSRITVTTLAQIPPSMEQAAQAAGAGWARRMSQIILPLAKRGLIGGWIVGYIFCLRDTGISMMAYPPGSDTFTVRTFTLMANNPPELIAALCVIMIMVTLIPLAMVAVLSGR